MAFKVDTSVLPSVAHALCGYTTFLYYTWAHTCSGGGAAAESTMCAGRKGRGERCVGMTIARTVSNFYDVTPVTILREA